MDWPTILLTAAAILGACLSALAYLGLAALIGQALRRNAERNYPET